MEKKQKSRNRTVWVIVAIFIAFTAFVFVTQKNTTINWVEDYERGMALSEEQNKPALLVFYKLFTQYTTRTRQDTFKSPEVKQYLEANFVPILINVDEQPKPGEKYNVDYYPTYYVQMPDSNDIFGPLQGYYPPNSLIKELDRLMEKAQGE